MAGYDVLSKIDELYTENARVLTEHGITHPEIDLSLLVVSQPDDVVAENTESLKLPPVEDELAKRQRLEDKIAQIRADTIANAQNELVCLSPVLPAVRLLRVRSRELSGQAAIVGRTKEKAVLDYVDSLGLMFGEASKAGAARTRANYTDEIDGKKHVMQTRFKFLGGRIIQGLFDDEVPVLFLAKNMTDFIAADEETLTPEIKMGQEVEILAFSSMARRDQLQSVPGVDFPIQTDVIVERFRRRPYLL